jgi:hypothetical protein
MKGFMKMRIQAMYKYVLLSVSMVAVLLAVGCSGKGSPGSQSFLRENIDMGFYERLALLPMANNSQDNFAAERVRDIVTTKVLSSGQIDLVDKGIVDAVLANEAINPGDPIDLPTLRRLGNMLKVQAFIMGTIDQAGENRKGAFSYPELELTLRMIDANEGTILWQASGYNSGYSLGGRIFGVEPKDAFQVAVELVDTLLATGFSK